jgi:hypothetical protein
LKAVGVWFFCGGFWLFGVGFVGLLVVSLGGSAVFIGFISAVRVVVVVGRFFHICFVYFLLLNSVVWAVLCSVYKDFSYILQIVLKNRCGEATFCFAPFFLFLAAKQRFYWVAEFRNLYLCFYGFSLLKCLYL